MDNTQDKPTKTRSIRIPYELEAKIKQRANQSRRSVNWIIIDALRKLFETEGPEGKEERDRDDTNGG